MQDFVVFIKKLQFFAAAKFCSIFLLGYFFYLDTECPSVAYFIEFFIEASIEASIFQLWN